MCWLIIPKFRRARYERVVNLTCCIIWHYKWTGTITMGTDIQYINELKTSTNLLLETNIHPNTCNMR